MMVAFMSRCAVTVTSLMKSKIHVAVVHAHRVRHRAPLRGGGGIGTRLFGLGEPGGSRIRATNTGGRDGETNKDSSALNGIREQQGRITEQNDILSAEIDDLQSLAHLASSPERFAMSHNVSHDQIELRKSVRREASNSLHERLVAFERENKSSLSPSDIGKTKHQMICRHRLEHQRNPFVCQKCWTFEPLCVCHAFDQNKAPLPMGIEQVIVWTNHNEWGRTSNTGSLLPLGLNNTTILMKGLEEHEQVMRMFLARDDLVPIVLWPGSTGENIASISLEELRVELNVAKKVSISEKEGEHMQEMACKSLLLIALEGTWNDARRMVNRLPKDVLRLDISDATAANFANSRGIFSVASDLPAPMSINSPSMLAPLRRQGNGGSADNVSTLEATIVALYELGLSDQDAKNILDIARLKVNRIREYTGKIFSR